MDIAAIVLGSLGFLLSLYIAIFEILRRYRKLVIFVSGLDMISIKDNAAIAILHICFLNPSTEYKTASHIGLDRPVELKMLEFVKAREAGSNITVCRLSDHDIDDLKLSSDELLETPLDVPPLQSLKKIYPYYIEWDNELELAYQVIAPTFFLYTQDINGNRIQSKPFQISLERLKNGGLFYLP